MIYSYKCATITNIITSTNISHGCTHALWGLCSFIFHFDMMALNFPEETITQWWLRLMAGCARNYNTLQVTIISLKTKMSFSVFGLFVCKWEPIMLISSFMLLVLVSPKAAWLSLSLVLANLGLTNTKLHCRTEGLQFILSVFSSSPFI